MRLSPKSVFVGLVAFGLPVAVAVGWNLAAPVKLPAAVGVPGGESVLGAAPTTARTTPVAVRYSAGPYRPKPSTLPASAVPLPSVPTTSPVVTTTSPSPTPPPLVIPSGVSEPPLPPLDEPPVPTPTDPSEASTPPDAEPPSSAPSSTELPTLFP